MSTNKSRRSHDSDQNAAYEALSFKGIEQLANYRSVSYRIDMLHVLDKKDAASIVYQIIYRWLEYRRDEILVEIERRHKAGLQSLTTQEVEERMWIYMSYNDFVRETGGAISYNTVIDALNYMVNKKRVLERRANSNPRYSDYEYRINKEEVRKLLGQLPEFPHFIAKGTKGKRQQPADSTKSGIVSSTAGSTETGTGSTKNGIASTETGTGSTKNGSELYQNWGTSQKQPQNPPQNTSQDITQQQQITNAVLSEETTATELSSILGNLSEEEIVLIQSHRQKTNEVALPTSEEMPPAPGAAAASKQAKKAVNDSEQFPDEIRRPESDTPLSSKVIVQLWEYLRGVRYEDAGEYAAQIQAASTLLEMRLPLVLTVDVLERVYVKYYDDFWRDKFGELHLSHLIETERSTKQIRIVRWLNRLRPQLAGKVVDADKSKAQGSVEGNVVRANDASSRMIEWNGRWVTEEEAYQDGYQGGFERFLPGDHPDDDLLAVAQRLQAEGKIVVPTGQKGDKA